MTRHISKIHSFTSDVVQSSYILYWMIICRYTNGNHEYVSTLIEQNKKQAEMINYLLERNKQLQERLNNHVL